MHKFQDNLINLTSKQTETSAPNVSVNTSKNNYYKKALNFEIKNLNV